MQRKLKLEIDLTSDEDDADFDNESIERMVRDELDAEFASTNDDGEDIWLTIRITKFEIVPGAGEVVEVFDV
jgi:hypothetical protein